MMFNVSEIAKQVAQGIVGRVDANPQDFMYDELKDVDAMVQIEIQDDLSELAESNEGLYLILSEQLCEHPEIKMAITVAEQIVDDYMKDMKSYYHGEGRAVGISNRDFI